ncbi:MAG: hypothetical protein WDO19_00350 [Bacteroidota bacterium]
MTLFSQKDFYSLYSFFNNIDEAGQISFDNATPGPSMLLTDAKQDSILAYINNKEKEKITEQQAIVQKEKPDFEKMEAKVGKLYFI